jgi:hypothetical protein
LGWKVVIYLNHKSLASKGDVFSELDTTDRNIDVIYHKSISNPSFRKKLLAEIAQRTPKAVFMLTLQNDWTAEFALELLKSVPVKAGLIHNTNLFKKCKPCLELLKLHNLVPLFLSQHVADAFSRDVSPVTKRVVVYNIFYPKHVSAKFSPNDSARLRIGLLGGVSFDRLDFSGLLDAVNEYRSIWADQICFVVIGGGGGRKELEKKVNLLGIDKMFEFSPLGPDGKSLYPDYYDLLRSCDSVLCLQRIGKMAELVEKKITSTVPAAISFLKPLLCSKAFSERYNLSGISHEGDSISGQIELFRESHRSIESSLTMHNNLVACRDELFTHNINALKNLTLDY